MEVLNDFGVLLFQRHQTEEAMEKFESALKLARAINHKKLYITLPKILNNVGSALASSGKLNKSLPYFVEAKETMDKLFGSQYSDPLTSGILNNLRANYYMLAQQNQALKCLEALRNIARETGIKHWMVVYVLVELIKIYARIGFILQSIMCYLEARAIAKSIPKKNFLSLSILEMLKLMEI